MLSVYSGSGDFISITFILQSYLNSGVRSSMIPRLAYILPQQEFRLLW